MRKQRINRCLGNPCKSGHVDHLVYNRPLKDLILWPNVEKLTLISGERLIQDSCERLGSF